MANSKSMKIVTVVGARPQFIKAAVVSRAFADHNRESSPKIRERIVHTGQHYDEKMSAAFFKELSIPRPAYNLGVGSSSHGVQTARMLEGIEHVLLKEKPNTVLVYGDTNSTLAGALAASKLLIPVAHVEAGLRSFNMAMPEEQNRIVTDHLSSVLFAPTAPAASQLRREGITSNVYRVGDVMFDSARYFLAGAGAPVFPPPYILATVHRAENTDDGKKIKSILSNLDALGREYGTVFLPAHPRIMRQALTAGSKMRNLKIIEPLSYSETLNAMKFARLVVTDSGGIQKEAFIAGTPCLTLREETEWVETVKAGANVLVGRSRDKLLDAAERFAEADFKIKAPPRGIYGDGRAGKRIVEIIVKKFGS